MNMEIACCELPHCDKSLKDAGCHADLTEQCRINVMYYWFHAVWECNGKLIIPYIFRADFKEIPSQVWYTMRRNITMVCAVTLLRGLVQ
jgi:hypothetical protein